MNQEANAGRSRLGRVFGAVLVAFVIVVGAFVLWREYKQGTTNKFEVESHQVDLTTVEDERPRRLRTAAPPPKPTTTVDREKASALDPTTIFVHDAESGRAVAGAKLWSLGSGGERSQDTPELVGETGTDGFANISLEAEAMLVVRHEDYRPHSTKVSTTVPSPIRMGLSRSGRILGKVVDLSGNSIEGARIVATPWGFSSAPDAARLFVNHPLNLSAVSDTSGKFRIDGVKEGEVYRLVPNKRAWTSREELLAQSGDEKTIVLGPLFAALVEFVDEDGGPIYASLYAPSLRGHVTFELNAISKLARITYPRDIDIVLADIDPWDKTNEAIPFPTLSTTMSWNSENPARIAWWFVPYEERESLPSFRFYMNLPGYERVQAEVTPFPASPLEGELPVHRIRVKKTTNGFGELAISFIDALPRRVDRRPFHSEPHGRLMLHSSLSVDEGVSIAIWAPSRHERIIDTIPEGTYLYRYRSSLTVASNVESGGTAGTFHVTANQRSHVALRLPPVGDINITFGGFQLDAELMANADIGRIIVNLKPESSSYGKMKDFYIGPVLLEGLDADKYQITIEFEKDDSSKTETVYDGEVLVTNGQVSRVSIPKLPAW